MSSKMAMFVVTFVSEYASTTVHVVLPEDEVGDAANTALCILADAYGQDYADTVSDSAQEVTAYRVEDWD